MKNVKLYEKKKKKWSSFLIFARPSDNEIQKITYKMRQNGRSKESNERKAMWHHCFTFCRQSQIDFTRASEWIRTPKRTRVIFDSLAELSRTKDFMENRQRNERQFQETVGGSDTITLTNFSSDKSFFLLILYFDLFGNELVWRSKRMHILIKSRRKVHGCQEDLRLQDGGTHKKSDWYIYINCNPD